MYEGSFFSRPMNLAEHPILQGSLNSFFAKSSSPLSFEPPPVKTIPAGSFSYLPDFFNLSLIKPNI